MSDRETGRDADLSAMAVIAVVLVGLVWAELTLTDWMLSDQRLLQRLARQGHVVRQAMHRLW